jgi:hypothetical protein
MSKFNKSKLEFPIEFFIILTLCTVGVFFISEYLEHKEAIILSALIFGIFSIYINDNSFVSQNLSKFICILLLLVSCLILSIFSELRNIDTSLVISLFSFPLFWTISTFIGNHYSEKKHTKVLNFIYFFNAKATVGKKVTGFDFIYTVVGFFSICIWGALISTFIP